MSTVEELYAGEPELRLSLPELHRRLGLGEGQRISQVGITVGTSQLSVTIIQAAPPGFDIVTHWFTEAST